MPNDDYILRSDVVSAFCGNCEGTEVCGQMGEPCEEVKRIMAIPAADVEPKRKTGQWIDVYVSNPARTRTMCSECGMFSGIGGIPSNRHKPYCPNCGSPMLPEPPKGEDDARLGAEIYGEVEDAE